MVFAIHSREDGAYNIGDITKRSRQSYGPSAKENGGALKVWSASDAKISQNNPGVNSNYMQNSKNGANSRSSKQIPIEFSEKLINDTDKSFSEKQGILKSTDKKTVS